MDVARRANGDSGALEGDRPLDGGREGTSVLRPLSNRQRTPVPVNEKVNSPSALSIDVNLD